jgi:hypothetical protein
VFLNLNFHLILMDCGRVFVKHKRCDLVDSARLQFQNFALNKRLQEKGDVTKAYLQQDNDLGEGFFFFSLFSMCSHQVLKKVPQVLMYFSQDVSCSTSILSHMVCGKFNSHVYKLKRWVVNEHIFFDFTIWGQKRCLYWGITSVPKKLMLI